MRSKIIAIGLVLSTLVAVPAFADETKGGPSFPIPAATFTGKAGDDIKGIIDAAAKA